ncbi:MAG: hypothetical protein HYU04_01080 [Candidatus Wildermuthbacteria bacterium]|nr:hypothetical protein [Candidatus Wildermuthbacteria bacterium]
MALDRYTYSGTWSEALHIYLYDEIVCKGKNPSVVNISCYTTLELTDELVKSYNAWLSAKESSVNKVEAWLQTNSEEVIRFQNGFGVLYKPKVELWSDRKKTGYYKEKLQASFEFETYISKLVKKKYGVDLIQFLTPEGQYQKGENNLGIEIKYDMMYPQTGNLYIEYEEKSKAENDDYVKSGIMKDDQCNYFLIGDYNNFWVFRRNKLVEIFNEEKKLSENGIKSARGIRFVAIATSRGYVFPIQYAEKETISLDTVISDIKK